MCFFFSLMPATVCVTIGYFVLFAASKADDKNIWQGLSNLAFCDCGLHSHRWRLRNTRWSLSHRGYLKDATFGKAMNRMSAFDAVDGSSPGT
jgi:hypothetical protein